MKNIDIDFQLLDLEAGAAGVGFRVGGRHLRRGSGHSLPGTLLKRTNQVQEWLGFVVKKKKEMHHTLTCLLRSR